jgi:hypothetical protein
MTDSVLTLAGAFHANQKENHVFLFLVFGSVRLVWLFFLVCLVCNKETNP